MTQNCLLAAALALMVPLTYRLGVPALGGGRQREAALSKAHRYTLADLVEQPAILVGMRCWGGDRRSLEPLLETLAPRPGQGVLPPLAEDRGPVIFD